LLEVSTVSKIKCPKCRSADIDHVGGKTRTSLNLNPLRPLTFVNHKPAGKQEFHCKNCGCLFKAKI
jgi:transposase-like protein